MKSTWLKFSSCHSGRNRFEDNSERRVNSQVSAQKANAITDWCINRNTVSQGRQQYLVIFSGQIESETFYCCILRGTLTNGSARLYWNCALEERPRSALRDDFTRNSLSECVIEFIIRKLLGALFFRTQKFSFISRSRNGCVSCLLLRILNCITAMSPLWPWLPVSSKGKFRACV